MGAVLLFNIFLTSSSQSMVLANMVLALMFVDINFGKKWLILGNDILGQTYFNVCRETLKGAAFCVNFHQISMEIHSGDLVDSELSGKIVLISMNGVLNYIILAACEPLVRMECMHNHKNPY